MNEGCRGKQHLLAARLMGDLAVMAMGAEVLRGSAPVFSFNCISMQVSVDK